MIDYVVPGKWTRHTTMTLLFLTGLFQFWGCNQFVGWELQVPVPVCKNQTRSGVLVFSKNKNQIGIRFLVFKEQPDPGFLGEKKETKTGVKPEVNWRYWNWFFRGHPKVLELEFCLSKNCAWNWTQILLYLKNQTQNWNHSNLDFRPRTRGFS